MALLITITTGLLALAFGGIAIKLWLTKDGQFSGSCSSQSPFLNSNGEPCSYCGKKPEFCENKS